MIKFVDFYIYICMLFIISTVFKYLFTGTVAKLCDREVAGTIPGPVIPKTLKMVLAALSLGAQH